MLAIELGSRLCDNIVNHVCEPIRSIWFAFCGSRRAWPQNEYAEGSTAPEQAHHATIFCLLAVAPLVLVATEAFAQDLPCGASGTFSGPGPPCGSPPFKARKDRSL